MTKLLQIPWNFLPHSLIHPQFLLFFSASDNTEIIFSEHNDWPALYW